MIKMTHFSLVLLGLLALAIGAAIGWFWKKRTEETMKAELKALTKENKLLLKQNKKEDKDVNRLKKQTESLKAKNANLDLEYKKKISDFTTKLEKTTANLATAKKTERELQLKHQQESTTLERLQKSYKKLEAKYQSETTNMKEWSTDRIKFIRQFKEVKIKLKQAEEKVEKITKSNEKLSKEIAENKAFVAKLRALKAQNAKYSEDLKYWEKKHYDTHHELANLKTKIDGIVERNKELELVNQTANQSNQQMLQKVQEFKTKFVDINNKYHRLVESQKN